MSDWHNKIDVTYSVSTLFLSNTPHGQRDSFVSDSFVFAAHSKSFTGKNSFTEKTITLRLVRTVVDRSGFKTSPLDSFKIDSGEASPIDILLNLWILIFIIIFIHHSSYY
jgi:hypothetical protein